MKLLLVEDNLTFVKQARERLLQIPNIEIVVANSRQSAIESLNSHDFDLIICDLKIPTDDGQLDAEEGHGIAVITFARSHCPGTPIVILSAFGTTEFATDAMRTSPRYDVVGDGTENIMVNYYTKAEFDRCFADIEQFSERLNQTIEIEIRQQSAGSDLSPDQARVIRIYARNVGGQIVEVDHIHSGFSPTKKFKVLVKSGDGHVRGNAFAKIGPIEKLNDEASRFNQLVKPTLPIGSFSALQYLVKAGAVRTGGLFYQRGTPDSLFEIIDRRQNTQEILKQLANNAIPWHGSGSQGEIRISDVRSAVIPDINVIRSYLGDLDYNAIEQRKVIAMPATQHCDLHPGNILICDNKPVLIDFAEVSDVIAGYDPVSLELSLLFHPNCAQLRGSWPSIGQAEHWNELENYLKQCPFADFVRECRAWAYSVSRTDRAVFTCVYAYAMKQLKYEDADKQLARALISFAIRILTQR